ncbi:hypothetical protein GH5_05515 [Leishmania sp. Ghana 2012 LV757]|uniref:hypothetical protein n=1 Tax=Leishmania sp. Ghana 2012 LV757 TaxID=2803181 RepID=UPI001B73A861|nr:hypothetical protein GH5_05515 [Leishmania sp. Ghana 2012 LV757]
MSSGLVIVGDSICGGDTDQKLCTGLEEVYLRGFNTFSGNHPSDVALLHEGAGEIVAAINGHIEVTDRVISVKGLLPRYQPEIGDVVVGRISEVTGNKWQVDVNSTQSAVMLLSNVTEPGGILRRRGRDDELGMRQLFDQGDLVAAEVQRITPDGVVSLHTRAAGKYGRLSGLGILVSVRPSLVKRAKHQFVELAEYSTQLIIGMNGNIWVCAVHSCAADTSGNEHAADARQNVARVVNCIKALGAARVQINPASIEASVVASLEAGLSAFDLSIEKHQGALLARVADTVGMKRRRQ